MTGMGTSRHGGGVEFWGGVTRAKARAWMPEPRACRARAERRRRGAERPPQGSTRPPRRSRARGAVWLALALWALGATGCAHVAAYQREYLADRIMDPAAMRREMQSERKMLSTREGATGGALGAGGGCACN